MTGSLSPCYLSIPLEPTFCLVGRSGNDGAATQDHRQERKAELSDIKVGPSFSLFLWLVTKNSTAAFQEVSGWAAGSQAVT